MKTMTSRTLLLLCTALFIYSSCTPEHQHNHQIISLPYLKNAAYFDTLCKNDSTNRRCWPYKPCDDTVANLSYIPFYCGSSARPEFTNNDSNYFIWVPYSSASGNLVQVKKGTDFGPVIGQVKSVLRKGSFGCNYFLPGVKSKVAQMTSPMSDSNSNAVPTTKSDEIQCALDCFKKGANLYINLLFISHAKHEHNHNDTITSFANVDFAISAEDYHKLDSLYRKYPRLTGGIDTPNIRKLYLYNGDTPVKIDSVTSPIMPIFPKVIVKNVNY